MQRCGYGLRDIDTGAQPLVSEDGSVALAVNGEIYNHKVLRKNLKTPYPFKTHSDCEVIIPLVGALALQWERKEDLTVMAVPRAWTRCAKVP